MCATLKEDVGIRFHELLARFSVDINQCKKVDKATANILPLKQENDNSVYPLEHYMCVGTTFRRKAFFKSIQVGDVIFGRVCNIFDKVVNVFLVSVLCGQNRWIEDLKILASGIIDDINRNDNELEVGDNVKAVITSVKKTSEEITISFNDKCLPEATLSHFPLGRVESSSYYRVSQSNSCKDFFEDSESRNLLSHLSSSSSFIDPHGVEKILDQFHVDRRSTFMKSQYCRCPTETADSLRERQSYKWSMDMVGAGVKHFREKEEKQARDCFDQAITFYPNNVEAFVARGALKANSNQLKDAIQDFKKALLIKPNHKNGKKYLIETLFSLSKSYEKDSKWKEASRCYKEILDYDGENTEALDHLKHVQHVLSKEVVSGRPTAPKRMKFPSLSTASQIKIEKLKELLEADTENTSDFRSSTSSSSSSSDSNSEDDWVEKTSSRFANSSKQTDRRYEKLK